MDDMLHITVAVPAAKLGTFYSTLGALLGGVAIGAMTTAAAAPAPAGLSPSPAPTPTPAPNDPAPAVVVDVAGAGAGAASDDGTLDSAGWPWSPELHASTKGVTKEGLWRMKVGVSRPDPKPGFPKETGAGGTGTSEAGTVSQAGATVTGGAATSTVDDDDEFAAFRSAAEKSNATDVAAAGAVVARTWTDADLGKLCNQAAVKLGDPTPIKSLIAEYCGADAVPHSRNVPADKREAFAVAIEKAADIVYAA